MTLAIIGAGWGRTATNSLKLALERLGYGTCHHMWEVAHDQDRLVPLWSAALDGRPDWPALFEGNRSAVDWPVAGFWRELAAAYPEAKFILTTRSPESWCASISETILQVIGDPEAVPEVARPVSRMARRAVIRSLGEDWSPETLIAKFKAHEAEVKASLPPERLLVFSPLEGWGPLCAFLGASVPEEPFPKSNHRDEFFANMDSIT
ncbi:sulfotransferase family protein [Seohaeicola zhoushanensis]|uniref:Sulfotransferase family protein n=1 Tax=Seohaeicola zhoushanensis TaxID=1569283 RepID=A0A8J3GVM6_9RHOB|nr:sulfotransferase family protein [Seohaeicola zhoushanensis]GHF39917.1 sulfotransferase family protein [Seohaeicola zhoushanensis]